jgi:nucleotide-binding universal stress UspA family protein
MHWERGSRSKETGGYQSILVPVNGSPAANRGIEFACGLAKRTKAKVYVVHVIEVRRALALDADLTLEAARGEEILDQAEALARKLDVEVEGDLLQARDAGHAIVDEATERNADVIILGVPFRKPFGDFQLGHVGSQILKGAPCEVILVRLPASEMQEK